MRVLSYNTQGAFADPTRAEEMLAFVQGTAPDVAFFSESHWSGNGAHHPVPQCLGTLTRSMITLQEMGYHVTMADDKDASPRPDRTGFIGIVRSELGSGGVKDAGSRQGWTATAVDPDSGTTLRFGGIHATDKSEEDRFSQVFRVSKDVDVLMGDLNAMHRGARVARGLRLLKPFAAMVPESDWPKSKIFLLPHMAKRLIGMASGLTLSAIEKVLDLQDVDPTGQPTFNHVLSVQLDHILAAKHLRPSGFTVHRDVKISDHFPISVDLAASPAA